MIIDLVLSAHSQESIQLLKPRIGSGPVLLCGPDPLAVSTAQRLYPDHRIEVKTLYQEPKGLKAGRLAMLPWMLKPRPDQENVEAARRRVIDTVIRLVQIAKEHDRAVLVAGPQFLTLAALKLNSIGYLGPLWGPWHAGIPRSYAYQA